jgi:hypothetical protein
MKNEKNCKDEKELSKQLSTIIDILKAANLEKSLSINVAFKEQNTGCNAVKSPVTTTGCLFIWETS